MGILQIVAAALIVLLVGIMGLAGVGFWMVVQAFSELFSGEGYGDL